MDLHFLFLYYSYREAWFIMPANNSKTTSMGKLLLSLYLLCFMSLSLQAQYLCGSFDLQPGSSSSGPSDITVCNNLLFFQAGDSIHGREPWVSDGTPAGTFMLKDINPGIANS